MASLSKWEPPADPDFEALARAGWDAWKRDRPRVVAFDTETTGLEFHDTAFCVQVAWMGPEGVEAHYFELERFDCRQLLRHVFAGAEVFIGHNLKFDLQKTAEFFGDRLLHPSQVHDTEALAHLDDEHQKKGLKDLAVTVLKEEDTVEIEVKSGPNAGTMKVLPREQYELKQAREWVKKKYGLQSIKEVGYDQLPRGTLVPYAVADARWTLELYVELAPKIAVFPEVVALYKQEMELMLGLLSSERHGLGVREKYVTQMIRDYGKRVALGELQVEQIVGLEVRTGDVPPKEKHLYFNPSSPKQVAAYLNKAGFTGTSFDKERLKTLDHPLAQALTALRADMKILGTYFRALQKGTRDGVFHPSVRQHGTVSGRTSSGAERGDG